MAIKDKIKNAFGRKTKDDASRTSTPSTSSETYYTGRTDIEYYKPHEIPKSKYRGLVDPEHKESLESYSFADAFNTIKRKSSQALSGIMSPGGTKSQSRRPSYMSRASSIDVKSSVGGSDTAPSRRNTTAVAQSFPGMTLVREQSDDDTALNSKQHVNE